MLVPKKVEELLLLPLLETFYDDSLLFLIFSLSFLIFLSRSDPLNDKPFLDEVALLLVPLALLDPPLTPVPLVPLAVLFPPLPPLPDLFPVVLTFLFEPLLFPELVPKLTPFDENLPDPDLDLVPDYPADPLPPLPFLDPLKEIVILG